MHTQLQRVCTLIARVLVSDAHAHARTPVVVEEESVPRSAHGARASLRNAKRWGSDVARTLHGRAGSTGNV